LRRLRAGLLAAGGGAFDRDAEADLLELHNAARDREALAPLKFSPALSWAARAHAADLVRRGYFAHTSPEGFSSRERVGLLCRRFVGAAGENLALENDSRSPPGAGEFMTLWLQSPGHRANVLRSSYDHVGFGLVRRGRLSVAAAAFGQTFAELGGEAPLMISTAEDLDAVIASAVPSLMGFGLEPLGGGGPGSRPSGRLPPGVFQMRPYATDPKIPRRYWILHGPVVLSAST
jgi:hypothetical protein